MSEFIEIISQIKPINDLTFPIADVNDLRGGYIQVNELDEMLAFLSTDKLKNGMLCYVHNAVDYNMFQYKDGIWTPWVVEGSSEGSIKVVDKLDDLDEIEYKFKGMIVFINEVNEIRYYNGESWDSFSRIYIQSIEPDDKGGIWVDTSEKKEHDPSNTVIQDLISAISILTRKVSQLEGIVRNQMDFGDFTNTKMNEFVGKDGVDPVDNVYERDSSEEDDNAQQEDYINTGLVEEEPGDMVLAGSLRIKRGTYAEMIANKELLPPCEPLYVTDRNQLWIKNPITLELHYFGSGGTDPDPDPPITDEMEGILQETINNVKRIVGIEMADMANTNNIYKIFVNNGALEVHDYRLDQNVLQSATQGTDPEYQGKFFKKPYFPISTSQMGSTTSPKIYINSIYCGGDGNSRSYNPVSHNFIEIANTGNVDVNLKGLFLHYTEREANAWVTLPLKGTLKSGSTFLIKGAQCSVENINTTYIKVGEADIEWTKDLTWHAESLDIEEDLGAGVEGKTIWDTNGLIKFNHNCSFHISGSESENYFKENQFTENQLWVSINALAEEAGVTKWYVDLVGIGSYESRAMPNESASFATRGNHVLLFRNYALDPVSQATPILSARKNSTNWTYINMDKIDPHIDIQNYVPKNSKQGKNMFFNKTLLKDGAPNIVTCSLGYNAHTTRCFNWVSVGYHDEFLHIKKEGDLLFESYESFKSGDGRSSKNNRNSEVYDRIRCISTDGTPFTVHKLIIDFEEPETSQKYIYKVGRPDSMSEERSFVLLGRDYSITNGTNFLHVTDQQGFNHEEYLSWEVSAEYISKDTSEKYDFCINTGDATQNGNRINEWIDYFNAGDHIFKNTAQMYCVGNNDLCPMDVHVLGTGAESTKINPINVQFFFTFEHPYEIPRSSTGVYINSVYSFIHGDTYFLAMNTEINKDSREKIFGDTDGINVFNNIKEWCESDLTKLDDKIKWKMAYCHEAPFTIIIADAIKKYLPNKDNDTGEWNRDMSGGDRGGSRINTQGNYWFSHFLQDNGFKLCLCGHKHTYSNTRYLRDASDLTMEPWIYDPKETPDWFADLGSWQDRNKNLCRISTDNTLNYVRYVMCQATGFKTISNKELPAQGIPWLMKYFPVTKQDETTTPKVDVTANSAQRFPNYIVWNIGTGNETESHGTTEPRERILGKSYKLARTADISKMWTYKYHTPVLVDELTKVGCNGHERSDEYIIVEKNLK